MVTSLYSAEEGQEAICVFLEHAAGTLESVSLELLSKGRQLAGDGGWPLAGLLIGHQIEDAAREAITYGADEVWLVEHPLLKRFTVDGYAHAAFHVLTQFKPSVFLCGATPNGRDLAGRLAVRLRTGLNADCTDLSLDVPRGVLICEVTGFGGGVLASLEAPSHRPQMATVRPGVFPVGEADARRQGEVVDIPIELEEGQIRTRTIEHVAGQVADLTKASVLVCGGRGVGGNFEMLEELARLLEGEVGATRPPVDEGHIERERQVGQTGVMCRPKVAFACGISGAFHFLVGIQDAEVIVAINSDPEAPIFESADFCILGDVSQIIPALIETLRAEREVIHG